MLKYDNTVSSQVDGKPIYGAQVTVYTADTDTPALATIFADEAGTTPLSQPILTDQLGYFAFYIGDGKYNIRVMTGAVEISRTNITMVDTLQLKQRALIVPVNEDGGTLPPADQRQNKLLGFDSGGNPTMAVPNSFEGPTGPANSTYTTLAGLKAAAVSNASYIFAPPSGSDGGAAAGTFLYQTAGAPYTADGVNVIKLDAVPLTTGALVRQGAQSIAYQADPGAPVRSQADVNANSVNVHDFRYAVETDDLGAWDRARTKGKPIRFVAGMGSGPGGVYLLNFATLTSGLEIYGDGARSVIRPTIAANGNVFRGLSSSSTTFIDDVTIRDLTLYGRVEEVGFKEPEHLISMNGSRRFRVLRCILKGALGDHIYLGSGIVTGDEKHNLDATFDGNLFDGLIRDNRNGISVIDGVGGSIANNTFTRLSRPNMPGPIDFEPDGLAFHRISDWTVENNRFDANDGNLGQIGFLFPAVVPLPARMTVRGNSFSNYVGTGADIAIDMRRIITQDDYDMAFTIEDNSGVNGRRPYDVYAAKGVKISQTNLWQDYVGNALIGLDQAAWNVDDRATLLRVGTSDAAGRRVGNTRALRIGGLIAKSGSATTGFPIQFASGSSQDVTLQDLQIVLNDGQTVAINSAGHTFAAASNVMRNVSTGGGTSQFQSQTEARLTVTGDSGWTVGASTLVYKNSEGRAAVDYDLASGTVTAGTRAFILPIGARPRTSVYFVALSGTSFCGLRADPDGSVFITPNNAPAAALRGQFTFNTGQ